MTQNKVKSPKWEECITQTEIQDVSDGQKTTAIGTIEIGMVVNSLYKNIKVFTEVENILENKSIEGNISRIDSDNGETVGDLSLGDKVFISFKYICGINKDTSP